MDLTKRYEWRGRQIAWGRAGAGPAVVFCHGTPWSSVVWRPIVDALSDRYTVYLWDMPGYGRSSKLPEHPVDFGVQAEILDALIRHWGLARPHVIAHDFDSAHRAGQQPPDSVRGTGTLMYEVASWLDRVSGSA